MAEQNDGGPAFPQSETANGNPMRDEHGEGAGGMTLADYFAAQILTGWLVSRESDVLLAKCGDDAEEAAQMAADAAYVVARAMLAARKNPVA